MLGLLLSSLLGAAVAAPEGQVAPTLPAADVHHAETSQPTLMALGATTRTTAGQPAALSLTIVVPPGYHVYRDMVAVEVLDAGDLKLGAPSLPAGLHQPDPAAPGSLRELYEFDAIIDVPVLDPAAPGTHDALLSVRYQACKNSTCLFPQTSEIVSTLVVSEPSPG